MSCETASEERQERSDSLKGYSLGLLPGDNQEQQQLNNLIDEFASALNRLDLQKADLGNTTRRISGDGIVAVSVDESWDRLLEWYLPGKKTSPCDQSDETLRSVQNQSIMQLLCDVHLSVPTFALTQSPDMRNSGHDDQISETLARLSFGPRFGNPLSSGKNLQTTGELSPSPIRSVLSQWELGSDPTTYVSPGLPEPHASSLGESGMELPSTIAPDSSTRTVRSPRQSGPSTSRQPIHTALPPTPSGGASLPTTKNQSQVHFAIETQDQSQDYASTQIVPGPFGSRNAPSFRRSLGKKRTIGF